MTPDRAPERPPPRVAVVGAGVLGLMSGWRLAQAGAHVTVYEAEPKRPNASQVAAGMIAPAAEQLAEPVLREIAPFLRQARDAWRGLAGSLGVALVEQGTAFAGDERTLSILAAELAQLGFMTARRPPSAAGDEHRLIAPDDAHLCAPNAMAALRLALERAGGFFRQGCVKASPKGLAVDDELLQADAVVLAVGAPGRGSGLAPELAHLSPIKGQLLRWANASSAVTPMLRVGEGFYLAATAGEQVAGATMERGRDDLEPEPTRLAACLAQAESAAPDLRGARPSIGVGVRVETPDGLPMVGPSAAPGLFLATGARRNGWLFAPLVAKIVTAQVLRRPLGDLAPLARRLHPGRFDPGFEKDIP